MVNYQQKYFVFVVSWWVEWVVRDRRRCVISCRLPPIKPYYHHHQDPYHYARMTLLLQHQSGKNDLPIHLRIQMFLGHGRPFDQMQCCRLGYLGRCHSIRKQSGTDNRMLFQITRPILHPFANKRRAVVAAGKLATNMVRAMASSLLLLLLLFSSSLPSLD